MNPTTFFFPHVGPYLCEICCVVIKTNNAFLNHITKLHMNVADPKVLEIMDKRIRNRAPLRGRPPKCTISSVKERELTPHPKKGLKFKAVKVSDDGGSSQAGDSDSEGDGSFQAGDNHTNSVEDKTDEVQVSGQVEIGTRDVAKEDGKSLPKERPMPESGLEDEFPLIDMQDDELLDGVVPEEEKEYTASQVIAKIEKLGLVQVSMVPKPEFVKLSTDDESEGPEVKA